jgi:hypothetical protein
VGGSTLLTGTNPSAQTPPLFAPLIAGAGVNDRIIRVHVHSLFQNPAHAGDIDPRWAGNWDTVLCDAQQRGLYVLPVLDVWTNWNDVAKPLKWDASIYNAHNVNCDEVAIFCGPAQDPSELLQTGATQDAWLDYIEGAVDAWKSHSNIVGWEVFSELDNVTQSNNTGANDHVLLPCPVTGTDLPEAVCLVEAAAARIRTADPGRPITASLKSVNDWPTLSMSSIDFLEIHPYADHTPIAGAPLDQSIIDYVRLRRTTYGKPVYIGESGLDQIFPDANALTLNARGWIGVNQAIWAGAVSGAMNSRSLWYEDGNDGDGVGRIDLCTLSLPQYANDARCTDLDAATTITLSGEYANASMPLKNFLNGVAYTDFAPVTVTSGSGNLTGAALGGDARVVGWVRDAVSVYDPAAVDPFWPSRRLDGEQLTVGVTGRSTDWRVDFWNTTSGVLESSSYVQQNLDGTVTLALPSVTGSIAFQIVPLTAIEAAINVRPQRRINLIAPGVRQPVPVAILGSGELNVADINLSTVRFGPGGAAAAPVSQQIDVDGDAYLDLVVLFRQDDTGLQCGDSEAMLSGRTNQGRSFAGVDRVRVIGIGCRGR